MKRKKKSPKPRMCRECGCTDERGCFPVCWWVTKDLCSSCVPGSAAGLIGLVAGIYSATVRSECYCAVCMLLRKLLRIPDPETRP